MRRDEFVSDVFWCSSRTEVQIESVPPRLLLEHGARVRRFEAREELLHWKGEHVVVRVGRREERVASRRWQRRHSEHRVASWSRLEGDVGVPPVTREVGSLVLERDCATVFRGNYE